jgi:hypothetical protein
MGPKEIKVLQRKIERVKKDLCELGDLRPGKLSEQFNVCGKSSCRCKDIDNPQKHGPYQQISYTHRGKSKTEFVKKENLKDVKLQLENYVKLKELTNEWVDLALELARMKKLIEKKT